MCSGSTVFPGPILAFISLRNRADPVYNSDGESFLVSGLIPDVDYTMCGSAPDKAILFNGGGKYINQLSEPQLDMYCGTFPTGKMQTTLLNIDWTEHAKMRGLDLKNGDFIKTEEPIIPARGVQIKSGGQIVTGYKAYAEPALYQ